MKITNNDIIQLTCNYSNSNRVWLTSKQRVMYDATDHFVLILKVYDYELEKTYQAFVVCDLIDLSSDPNQILYEEPIFYNHIRLIE